jgi:hypothetical protein
MSKKNQSYNDQSGPEEAKRILDRINRDSETIATSSIARTSDQFKKHLGGVDGNADDEDPVEILGKKIGRSLGWIAVIMLIIYLLNTYLF